MFTLNYLGLRTLDELFLYFTYLLEKLINHSLIIDFFWYLFHFNCIFHFQREVLILQA